MKIIFSIFLIALSIGAIAIAGALEGSAGQIGITIARIVDGDTVRATGDDGKPYTIRLASIDAPEKAQTFGKEAAAALAKMATGKHGRLEFVETDRYGRTVGMVTLDDNALNINYWMVSTGNAHYYEKYSKWMERGQAEKFKAAYQEAARRRVGLWLDVAPVMPEEFRKEKRQG
ncbi:MAG: thermonuclease family protein [Thiothrix sp.]|uniref:thermonuclease family protein n=1 Tax=Thiothrix sp. TaxID=1032 RepID=UPI00261010B3|nr:thermonuclease family protein [Thiothrix sp.]MDD5392419.1 thermonuclease family protein [Thiothrix sp.]